MWRVVSILTLGSVVVGQDLFLAPSEGWHDRSSGAKITKGTMTLRASDTGPDNPLPHFKWIDGPVPDLLNVDDTADSAAFKDLTDNRARPLPNTFQGQVGCERR